jgi:hypothetical protein
VEFEVGLGGGIGFLCWVGDGIRRDEMKSGR